MWLFVCVPNITPQTSSSVDALVRAGVPITAAAMDALFSEVHLSLKRLRVHAMCLVASRDCYRTISVDPGHQKRARWGASYKPL